MDFRHLIVICLFSKLRLPFDNQKVKENYDIFLKKSRHFFCLQASPVSLPPARGFSSFRMRVKVCF